MLHVAETQTYHKAHTSTDLWHVTSVITVKCQLHGVVFRPLFCSFKYAVKINIQASDEQTWSVSDTQCSECVFDCVRASVFTLREQKRGQVYRLIFQTKMTTSKKTRCYFAVMSCHAKVWAACLKCKNVFL